MSSLPSTKCCLVDVNANHLADDHEGIALSWPSSVFGWNSSVTLHSSAA
jgi:hypothetical protein